MPTDARPRTAPLPRRSTGTRTRRRGTGVVAYALFYSVLGGGIAMLAFAGMIAWSPPAAVAHLPAAHRQATIRLNQSDGLGQCRQVNFDNSTGRFAEAGTAPCPNDIPSELQIQNVDRARSRTEAISKSFRN